MRGGFNPGGGGNNLRRRQNTVRETKEDVRKFLTYYKRKNSICIDLDGPAFYKRNLFYDELAEFVYDILCPTIQLRADLEDVQLHPVKKHLLIKFKTVDSRDVVAVSLAGDGLEWPAFSTKVQGWAMDKPVMFVRVLGASPLSSMQEVKEVMEQYGEVIEVKKGLLSKKLPNVTNGTWTVRMVVGEDKTIPSFVFVRDEGEIWQLAHDSQATICWKCGKEGHIGGRCKEQAVSIDVDLLPEHRGEGGVEVTPPVQTWAHVVRRGAGGQQSQTQGQQGQSLGRQSQASGGQSQASGVQSQVPGVQSQVPGQQVLVTGSQSQFVGTPEFDPNEEIDLAADSVNSSVVNKAADAVGAAVASSNVEKVTDPSIENSEADVSEKIFADKKVASSV